MNIASRPAASRRLMSNGPPLRFAQFVSHLGEELELQLGVALEEQRQLAHGEPIEGDPRDRLRAIDVSPPFGEPEQVTSKQERTQLPLAAPQVAVALDGSLHHREHRIGRGALAIDDRSCRQP